jgi:hypothetical protein
MLNFRFYEETIPRYNLDDFRAHFRLSRGTSDVLLRALTGSQVFKRQDGPGRPPIPTEKAMLASLWLLATPDSYRSVSTRFGLPQSTTHDYMMDVIDVIVSDLCPQYIQWPTGERAKTVMDGFQAMRGLEGVIGAVDGTHIPISAPHHEHADYINRKGFHSLNFQAVCDHTLCFTDVFAGYPGKVHDARVYRNSPLYESVTGEGGQLTFPDNSYILGDGAYPIHPRLLTPFRDTGRLTAEQSRYNKYHSSTRMVIERAFGLVKARFRRLRKLEMGSNDTIIKFVIAAFVLHNMCVREGEPWMDAEMEENDAIGVDAGEVEEEVSGVCRRVQVMQSLM